MSYPPASSSGSSPFGASLLDKSKANPASVDMSIFEKKKGAGAAGGSAAPMGQGTTSSDYLKKTKEDNLDPDKDAKAASKVMLSGCKFETPADQLVVSEPFEMSCQAKGTSSEAPTKLRVIFRLYVSYQDDKGATVKEDLKASWEGFMEGKVDQQTVKAKGTLYRPNAPLGTKLQYQLVAEHPEAADKAESPVAEVVAKIDVWVQPLELAHFRDGGIVPQLDAQGMFPAKLASAIEHANQKNPLGETASVVVQGFAAKGSGSANDVELAALRARMVKALLSRDQGASEWAALAKVHGTPADVDQILSSLQSIYRWSIESDDAHERMRHFQEECNMRFGMGLKEDGILGPKTWGAVHRALVSLIQEEIGEHPMEAPKWTVPTWIGATKGAFGWGAHAPEDSGEHAVEICLVYGKNPGIVEPPKGGKPETKHNVIQKKEAVTKKPLEQKPKKVELEKPTNLKPAGQVFKLQFPFPKPLRDDLFKREKHWHKEGKWGFEGRWFGAHRDVKKDGKVVGSRNHAGCDILAPLGTPIHAVADGVVIEHAAFYEKTWVLSVLHDDGFIVRYGEIKPGKDAVPKGVRMGARITKGQVVAYVGKMKSHPSTMLHLEMYLNTAKGNLSLTSNKEYDYVQEKDFMRRKDLIDPTPHLDAAVEYPPT